MKRVPVDFDWPIDKKWHGYVQPDTGWPACAKCDGTGYHPHAQPIVSSFYALYVDYETSRKIQWCDKITQDEVNHLIAHGRLRTLVRDDSERGWRWESLPRTAAEVNALNARASFDSHDVTNKMLLCEYRCERLGIPYTCDACDGHGDLATNEQRAAYDTWEPTEPPAGDGWQLWETTSEGRPISPVFPSAEQLAEWCAQHATMFSNIRLSAAEWLATFQADATDDASTLVAVVRDDELRADQAEPMDLDKLAKALDKSTDDVGKALPADERAAYQAALDSVIRARRSAE